MTRLLALLLAAAALSGCAMHRAPIGPQPPHEPIPPAPSVRVPAQTSAPLRNMSGATIGQVSLDENANGVTLRVNVDAGQLSPGEHGMFLYDRAACAPPPPPTMLGATMPGLAATGAATPALPATGVTPSAAYTPYDTRGLQPGDLPALVVPGAGPVTTELLVRPVTLASSSRTRMALRDANGAALVIEDRVAPPRARVACALIGTAPQTP